MLALMGDRAEARVEACLVYFEGVFRVDTQGDMEPLAKMLQAAKKVE